MKVGEGMDEVDPTRKADFFGQTAVEVVTTGGYRRKIFLTHPELNFPEKDSLEVLGEGTRREVRCLLYWMRSNYAPKEILWPWKDERPVDLKKRKFAPHKSAR